MLLSRALWSGKTFVSEREREKQDNAESRFGARVNVLILEPILCSTHFPQPILLIQPNPCSIPKTLHFFNYLNWLSNDNFWQIFLLILGWFWPDRRQTSGSNMGNFFLQFWDNFVGEFRPILGPIMGKLLGQFWSNFENNFGDEFVLV
jgi:hypothetical protein